MARSWVPWTFAVIPIVSAWALPAEALEYEMVSGHRLFLQSLSEEVLVSQYFFQRTSTVTEDRAAHQMFAYARVHGRPFDALGLEIALDTGLIEIGEDGVLGDGRPFGTHAKETLLLGEALFDLQLGEDGVLQIKGGRLRPLLGLGFIYDAYAFGGLVDVDLGLVSEVPLSITLQAVLPDGTFTSNNKANPLIELDLSYELPFGRASLFGPPTSTTTAASSDS